MESPTLGPAFVRVVEILHRLRAPNGCPWDRAQTFDTIRPYALEETYEVLEAISERDWTGLREELGDLLLQVVFYAELAREMPQEEARFDIEAVLGGLADKLVRRHPHVFGDGPDAKPEPGLDAAQALRRWDAVKAAEKRAAGAKADEAAEDDSLLAGIPKHLPALAEAAKIGGRAAAVGFDWSNTAGVLDKLEEELHELRTAVELGQETAAIEDELGDVLFTVVNLARRLQLEPESALKRASRKFTRRFRWMEQASREQGRPLAERTPEEADVLWRQAKADAL